MQELDSAKRHSPFPSRKIVSTFRHAIENPDGWEVTTQLRWRNGVLEQMCTNKYTVEEEWHAVQTVSDAQSGL